MSLLNCRPHTTIGGTMPKDYPRCQARTRASLSKEGTSAFSSVVFNAPVSSKRWGTWQAVPGGEFNLVAALPSCVLGLHRMNFEVLTPHSLDSALDALASDEKLVPLAGATDLMVY